MKREVKNIVEHCEISEKEIERYLVRECRRIVMPCLKYSNPFEAGYPDRLVVMPGGKVVWVELKSKGQKPRRIQTERMESLRRLGHFAVILDSKEGVDMLIYELEYAV